jgi:alpha-tubulin suppressor-like RCC1 family protein
MLRLVLNLKCTLKLIVSHYSFFQVLTVVKDLRDKNQFVRTITAGDLHAIIVTGSGIVWSWGHNSDGQLGLGDTIRRSVPHLIKSLSSVVAVSVAAGARHSLVLASNGQVWAFGNNQRGQLGLGDLSPRTTPTLIIGALASAYITAITAGQCVHFESWHHRGLFIYFILGITVWL